MREDARSLAFVPLAELLRREGQRSEALAVIRAGLRHHPEHGPARVVLARIHLGSGNRALALGVVEEVVQLDPENVAAGAMLAGLLVEDGRLREAEALLERLRLSSPADPVVQALLARARPPVRRLHGERGDPFDTEAWADHLAGRGDYPRATRAWQRIFGANPRDARARGRVVELSRALDGHGSNAGTREPPRARHRVPGYGDAVRAVLDDHEGPVPVTAPGWARVYWSD